MPPRLPFSGVAASSVLDSDERTGGDPAPHDETRMLDLVRRSGDLRGAIHDRGGRAGPVAVA